MKKELGFVANLVSSDFNQMSEQEKKLELERAFKVFADVNKGSNRNMSNVSNDLVINEAILGLTDTKTNKSDLVSVEEIEKMLISSGNTDILKDIQSIKKSPLNNAKFSLPDMEEKMTLLEKNFNKEDNKPDSNKFKK